MFVFFHSDLNLPVSRYVGDFQWKSAHFIIRYDILLLFKSPFYLIFLVHLQKEKKGSSVFCQVDVEFQVPYRASVDTTGSGEVHVIARWVLKSRVCWWSPPAHWGLGRGKVSPYCLVKMKV